MFLISLLIKAYSIFPVEALAQNSKFRSKAAQKKEQQEHRKSKFFHRKKQFGPFLGLGLPHPIDFGVSLTQVNSHSHIATGGSYSFALPKGKFRNLEANIFHLEYKYRSIPSIRHPVYWGVGLGLQRIEFGGIRPINLKHDESGTNVTIDVLGSMEIIALYWSPHVGFVWYQKNGFHSGFSFGYLIPFWSEAKMNTRFSEDEFLNQAVQSTSSYQNLKNDLEKLGRRVGKFGLPILNIIELGYLF